MVDEDETMEVASVGGRKPRVMARRILSEILQPRAEEIFHLVWDEIRARRLREDRSTPGIVLTGGGAILDGMPEIAEQIFDLPIRRGCPTGVGGLADHVNSPTFATGVGLVLYAHRNRAANRRARRSAPARSAAWPGGCAACSKNFSNGQAADGRLTRSDDMARYTSDWTRRRADGCG